VCRLDSTGWRQGSVTGSFEHGDKPPGYTRSKYKLPVGLIPWSAKLLSTYQEGNRYIRIFANFVTYAARSFTWPFHRKAGINSKRTLWQQRAPGPAVRGRVQKEDVIRGSQPLRTEAKFSSHRSTWRWAPATVNGNWLAGIQYPVSPGNEKSSRKF
jgi:hypothetical protein